MKLLTPKKEGKTAGMPTKYTNKEIISKKLKTFYKQIISKKWVSKEKYKKIKRQKCWQTFPKTEKF